MTKRCMSCFKKINSVAENQKQIKGNNFQRANEMIPIIFANFLQVFCKFRQIVLKVTTENDSILMKLPWKRKMETYVCRKINLLL